MILLALLKRKMNFMPKTYVSTFLSRVALELTFYRLRRMIISALLKRMINQMTKSSIREILQVKRITRMITTPLKTTILPMDTFPGKQIRRLLSHFPVTRLRSRVIPKTYVSIVLSRVALELTFYRLRRMMIISALLRRKMNQRPKSLIKEILQVKEMFQALHAEVRLPRIRLSRVPSRARHL